MPAYTPQVRLGRADAGDPELRWPGATLRRWLSRVIHGLADQDTGLFRPHPPARGQPTWSDRLGPGPETAQQIESLTRINTAELLEALGLDRARRGRALLEWLCRPAACHIARRMALYDRVLAERGLRDGARSILPRLGARLQVAGADRLPRAGPLLIACNHPGLSDALAIFASLERTDLRIVAADYPLLRALSGIRRHVIFVPRQPGARLQAVPAVVSHLRAGGAVLLMPAGRIEPDPAVLSGAAASLETWSTGLGLIVRLAPGTCVVPAIVSGVLAPSAQRHPLTRLRRSPPDRQRLGTTLQVLAPATPQLSVRLTYGRPLNGAQLVAGGRNAHAITRVLVEHAHRLLQESCEARADTAPGLRTGAGQGMRTDSARRARTGSMGATTAGIVSSSTRPGLAGTCGSARSSSPRW